MKTVSTKLDKKDHERLLEMCNDEGKSIAEEIRELVQMCCNAWEEGKEMEKEEKSKPMEEPKIIVKDVPEEPKVITHGKILDDNGNVIGTF